MLTFLIYLGFLLMLVGSIALIIAAFRTSIWWGLAVLFISPVALIYVIVEWKSAKNPFLTQLAGFLLLFAAVNLFPSASVTEVIRSGAGQVPFIEEWVSEPDTEVLVLPDAQAPANAPTSTSTTTISPQVLAMDEKRKLPLQGAGNCRDMGGLQNTEGYTFKQGLVMRCDNLGGLTASDIEFFTTRDLTSIIDLRTEQEINATPDKYIPTVVNDQHISIASGDLTDYLTQDASGDFSNAMHDLYRRMVLDKDSQQKIRDVFVQLQNPNTAPVVFHCTAGKDRTGVIAMLLLHSLNFSKNTIMNDYMASLPNVEVMYAKELAEHPQYAGLLLVKPDYLNTAINAINEQYGSVNEYLDNVIQIDRNQLGALYLSTGY